MQTGGHLVKRVHSRRETERNVKNRGFFQNPVKIHQFRLDKEGDKA